MSTPQQCEYARNWYYANRDKIRAQQAEYRKRARADILAGKAEYRKNNVERIRSDLAAWRARNLVKKAADDAAWRAANPEKVRSYRHIHRALKRSAPGSFTASEWKAIVDRNCASDVWVIC